MNRFTAVTKSTGILEKLGSRYFSSSRASNCGLRKGSYESRRVVVTGLGGVTPLGVDIPTSWRGLVDGRCGIRRIDEDVDDDEKQFLPIYLSLPSKVAARVPLSEFKAFKQKHFTSSDFRMMSKAMVLGVLAAEEAVKDAGKHAAGLSRLVRSLQGTLKGGGGKFHEKLLSMVGQFGGNQLDNGEMFIARLSLKTTNE